MVVGAFRPIVHVDLGDTANEPLLRVFFFVLRS
jgi:hypothetical protein